MKEKDTRLQVHTMNILLCFYFVFLCLHLGYSVLVQSLEKHLERQREELRKEREDNRAEKQRRQKNEKAVTDSYDKVVQVCNVIFYCLSKFAIHFVVANFSSLSGMAGSDIFFCITRRKQGS